MLVSLDETFVAECSKKNYDLRFLLIYSARI
jgi:hypothetical protein